MIKNSTPMSISEIDEYVNSGEEKPILDFIKNFKKLDSAEAKKLREELKALDILKVKEDHIVKIVDLLPEDAEELNKIVIDANLDEDEINKILDKIKEFK